MEQNLTVKQFISSLNQHSFEFDDLEHLLESNRPHLVQIFKAIIKHPHYQIVAKKILHKMITNVYKMINEPLELYIIANIWKKQFLHLFHQPIKQQYPITQKTSQNDILVSVYMFLCQKMRSLKFLTRITALKSLQTLLKSILHILSPQTKLCNPHLELTPQQAQDFDKFLSFALRRMLKKQELGKVVSYNQGLFLQLLQDEFHEIRVTTLAFLELVSLKTPYFYSIQAQKGQNEQTQAETLNSLKQTILYMLNDEHELVRERSLVAIFRISQAKNKINNLEVFNPLSQEQIFTILMCLRENNAVLRQKVYECLKVLNLVTIDELFMILQKLYQTLLAYKQDKTKIYWLLKSYSQSQKQIMLDFIAKNPKENIKRFYNFSAEEEPSCKNRIYKGRIILLREVILQFLKPNYTLQNGSHYFEYGKILPGYILRHSSFVEDTEFNLKYKGTENYEQVQQNLSKKDEIIIIEQEGFMDKGTSQKVQYLQRIKSIINYEYSLTEKNTFEERFLWVILESVNLMIDHVSTQNQCHNSKSILYQAQKGSNWFDAVFEVKQNNYNRYDEQLQTMAVDQSQVEKFLYGNQLKNQKRQKLEARSVDQKISQIIFEIDAIKYLYSLEPNKETIKNFHIKNLIVSLLSSIETVLKTLPQISYSIDTLCRQVDSYLKTVNKNTQLKQKRFSIRPITIGRASLGTGYSDKLLLMIEHPTMIRDIRDLKYQNQNIWVRIDSVRTQFDPENQQFRSSTKVYTYFAKFQEFFRISDMRPLIDYNQNKTMYSAQIPLKITDSKESLLYKYLKNSSQKDIMDLNEKSEYELNGKTKKSEELNADKYIDYQEREIVIKSIAIVFVSGKAGIQDKMPKVLAEWSVNNTE